MGHVVPGCVEDGTGMLWEILPALPPSLSPSPFGVPVVSSGSRSEVDKKPLSKSMT